jgi:hypothetical protein
VKRLLVLALSLTAATAACGDALTGLGGSVTGTYSLRAVNGVSLPAPIRYVSADDNVQVVSATIRLESNGTFTDVSTLRDTYYGPATVRTETAYGEWSQSGDQIVLTDPYDPSYRQVGIASGGRLSFINAATAYGATLEYER